MSVESKKSVYWCHVCGVPLLQKQCENCGGIGRRIVADLKPVFEAERRFFASEVDSHGPPVLYGLEFMYRRDPLTYSRGRDREKGIEAFLARVGQDADKLLASRQRGFMDQIGMLTFVKGSSEKICSVLRDKLSRRDEVVLCFSD